MRSQHGLKDEMLSYELGQIVGRENVATDPVDLQVYGVDYFWVPRNMVDSNVDLDLPDVVVVPGSTEEISEILRLAQLHRIPVIPFGGGSGSQGGIIPLYGGITIDFKRMNRVLEIDEISGTVTAEAGVNGFELESYLQERGWTLPHYPASAAAATLGGYLAARGSGVLSTKYGKAEDMVLSMEVVFADGSVCETLPVPTHASGPGTMQMILGSEGSLGLITKATMQIERVPEVRRLRAILVKDISTGMELGRRIMIDRLQPLVLRLYDERSTQTVAAKTLGLTIDQGSCWVVLGFDGFANIADAQLARALDIVEELGATDLGPEPAEHWWDHRYDFYVPPNWHDVPTLFGTTDTLATFKDIEGLVAARRSTLESKFAEWDLEYYAHFSHWFPWGAMVYDRFVVNEPPTDATEALYLHNEIWDTSVRVALDHGGVINEHHGVGLKLARFVREQYGAGFALIDGAKQAVDPNGILNPGKMGFGPVR